MKYYKDSHTRTQCIIISERKWTAQLDDLTAAYLAWKNGSPTLTMTDKEFAVQYIDIFGMSCYLHSISFLTILKISSSLRHCIIFRSMALDIGMSPSLDRAALHCHLM